MKKFPYSWPEVAYMVLVMALPLLVVFLWRSETIWGFVGKLGAGMLLGFGVWIGWGFIVCRIYDRKKRDENKQA